MHCTHSEREKDREVAKLNQQAKEGLQLESRRQAKSWGIIYVYLLQLLLLLSLLLPSLPTKGTLLVSIYQINSIKDY